MDAGEWVGSILHQKRLGHSDSPVDSPVVPGCPGSCWSDSLGGSDALNVAARNVSPTRWKRTTYCLIVVLDGRGREERCSFHEPTHQLQAACTWSDGVAGHHLTLPTSWFHLLWLQEASILMWETHSPWWRHGWRSSCQPASCDRRKNTWHLQQLRLAKDDELVLSNSITFLRVQAFPANRECIFLSPPYTDTVWYCNYWFTVFWWSWQLRHGAAFLSPIVSCAALVLVQFFLRFQAAFHRTPVSSISLSLLFGFENTHGCRRFSFNGARALCCQALRGHSHAPAEALQPPSFGDPAAHPWLERIAFERQSGPLCWLESMRSLGDINSMLGGHNACKELIRG